MMGSDLLEDLHQWQDGDRIINKTPCIVFNRKGFGQSDEDVQNHVNYPKN